MTVTSFERRQFGEPLTPAARLVAGFTILLAAVGHALLGGVAAMLLYVLVTIGL